MIDKPLLEDEDILKLYSEGVRDFTIYKLFIGQIVNTSLAGVNFSGLDLSDSYMEGIDLSGANLTGTYFNSACLDHSNLSGANLSGAELSWATFKRANLTGAILNGANLGSAEIIRSNLTDASLLGADIEHLFLKENIYRNTIWVDGSIRNE